MYSRAKIVLLSLLCLSFVKIENSNNTYFKEYYENGNLKAEGWISEKKKAGYWKFYFENGAIAHQGHYESDRKDNYWYYFFENGQVEKEGHYSTGSALNWWIYYNQKGHIIHKCQLDKGIKNGYCLKYSDQKLISAEKYQNGQKIDEWFNFSSFKRDNNLSDLK